MYDFLATLRNAALVSYKDYLNLMLANYYGQPIIMSIKFIQNMAEPSRDCSKSRPTTFSQITFSISQEIDNKIKNKNIGLRKAAWARLQERQKNVKTEENKSEIPTINLERGPFNYLQLYKTPKRQKERVNFCPDPELCKLEENDEQMTLQIYLLLKKRKPIFKVQQIKRKLRNKQHSKRMNYKQCECCGACGRHRCTHILCQRKCAYFKQPIKNEEDSEEEPIYHPEPIQMVAIAQELIDQKDLHASGINIVHINVKEQQIMIPQIDVIDDEAIKKELEEQLHGQINEIAEGVIETERISEVQSKSEVSESRRHRNEVKELQDIQPNLRRDDLQLEEKILQQIQVQEEKQ